MSKLFWYTRREPLAIQVEGQEQQFKEFKDSFAMDKVIRSIEIEGGQYLILLNDIHSRVQEVPITNKKNEITGYKKETITVQSEIYLLPEDAERYYKLTNIE